MSVDVLMLLKALAIIALVGGFVARELRSLRRAKDEREPPA